MDKQLIERIALEEAGEYGLETDAALTDFAHRFLARIDAERGKEAVATKLATDNPFSCFKVSLADSEKLAALPAGTKLFLSPTIPEGTALVPIEPTAAMVVAGVKRTLNKDDPTTEPYNIYKAMLAAQGERNAD